MHAYQAFVALKYLERQNSLIHRVHHRKVSEDW